MSLGRAKHWEHPTTRVCLICNGTSPSCTTSVSPALAAGAAPAGSCCFPKLSGTARERACWETQSYGGGGGGNHELSSSNPLETIDVSKMWQDVVEMQATSLAPHTEVGRAGGALQRDGARRRDHPSGTVHAPCTVPVF